MHNSATTHHAHAACKTLLRPIFTCARIHSECMHFSVICQYAHALRSLSACSPSNFIAQFAPVTEWVSRWSIWTASTSFSLNQLCWLSFLR